jgi:hypothetical protein
MTEPTAPRDGTEEFVELIVRGTVGFAFLSPEGVSHT